MMWKDAGLGESCDRCGRVTRALIDELGRLGTVCFGCPGYRPGERPEPQENESSGLRVKAPRQQSLTTRIKTAVRERRVAATTPRTRYFKTKPCAACGKPFTPTGGRSTKHTPACP